MKIIRVFLNITDHIKLEMEKGLEFEAARRNAFSKYEKELKEIKDYESNRSKAK